MQRKAFAFLFFRFIWNRLAEKLEFVGMPPRAMRAFARVVVFPSFGHARFDFAVVVYSI